MARQKGIFTLTGRLGNVSFYKSPIDGFLAKTRGGPSKIQIKNAPVFARTREHLSEFGRAVQAAKLFRRTFWPLLSESADSRVTSRLNGLMCTLKNLDESSVRGARTVADGIITTAGRKLLFDFQFTKGVHFSSTLQKLPTFNSKTGSFSFKNFDPQLHLPFPPAATHAQITIACSRLDFDNGERTPPQSDEVLVSYGSPVTDLLIKPGLPPNGAGSGIYLLRILFLQQIGERFQPLKDRRYNRAAVIAVV